jgi:pantoate--beta-alanine ligase
MILPLEPWSMSREHLNCCNVFLFSFFREGSIRPNFFRGVCTIVSKLYNAIQPTHAFYGQKDAQQCVILNTMTQDLLYPIHMRIGETMRLPNGLAMSSRNVYLSTEEKERASILYQALMKGKSLFDLDSAMTPQKVLEVAQMHISTDPKVQCQYLKLSHPTQLNDVNDLTEGAIFSGAIVVGKTRIIDNILIGRTVDTWFSQ